MRKILVSVVLLVLVVVVVVVVWELTHRNSSHAVSATSVRVHHSSTASAGERPVAGTYTFTGAGAEHVDLLGGSSHTFPKTIPVDVTLGSGCAWTATTYFVQEHTDTDQLCTDASGVRETQDQTDIQFLGVDQKDTFQCPADAYRLTADAAVGSTRSWTCKSSDTDFNRTAKDLGAATVTVDGHTVQTEHVQIHDTLTLGKTGTSEFDYWYLPTGLFVKFDVKRDFHSPTPLGTTHYQQTASYTITSTTPR